MPHSIPNPIVNRRRFPMTKVLLIALALIFAGGLSVANAADLCARQPSAKQCTAPAAKNQKTAVLCCCRTQGGGQCCANVSFCGGYVPGCMCSPYYRPAAPQLSSAR